MSFITPGTASGVATGVNILKNGSDPELKPDSEYPEWLWKLTKPAASLGELAMKYKAGGIDALNMDEVGPGAAERNLVKHHGAYECLNRILTTAPIEKVFLWLSHLLLTYQRYGHQLPH